MKTIAVHAGSLLAVLTLISGWAAAADQAVGQSVATAPAGQSRTTRPDQFVQLRWDLSQKSGEIDLSQFYGDDGYHATGHLWPAAHLSPGATITKHIFSSGYKHKIAPDLFKNMKVHGVVKGVHRYGGEITPQWVIVYFDRKEVARFPTMEEWKTPLYMLVDLVITKPEEEAVFPMDLTVKNVSDYLPAQPYQGQRVRNSAAVRSRAGPDQTLSALNVGPR